jgi:hypothetical protein
MVRAAATGLIGCVIFLVMARLAGVWPVLNQPVIMLASFAILVISPWFAILASYARSLRYVTISKEGLEIATRFKVHKMPWASVDRVILAQDDRHDTYRLSLVVMAKDDGQFNFELDFNENTTPIRARSYFVREIMHSWGEPTYASRKSIDTSGRTTLKA